MAFPKHNINIMFLELECGVFGKHSPLLYLPIKKTAKFFNHFPGATRKRHLYVRTGCFSKPLLEMFQPLFSKMRMFSFLFISSTTDSCNDFLNHIDLELLKNEIFQCTDRQRLQKWIRLVKKSKKKWQENHPVFGKYLFLCSFLLAHAFSEHDLKLQFRLVSQ